MSPWKLMGSIPVRNQPPKMDFRGFFIDFYDFHISYCKPPGSPKKNGGVMCAHLSHFGHFLVSHLFLRSVRRQKNPPNKWSQKIHESMPQIFGGTNLENVHFNRADVHCYGVGIWPCCSGDICWRIPFSLSAWRWCFLGQWPLRCFRAVLSQV